MISKELIKNWQDKIFIWKEGHCLINGEFAYFMSSTYGIPPDSLQDMMNEIAPPGSQMRKDMILVAYDQAHGTDYLETSKKLSYRIYRTILGFFRYHFK